ncbi:hypothetical protein HHI36_016684 [Cryptolaemus montrouzieri]|uniref:Uncharacterized protein n=1 Tax=Cryptolaemus montrouzieri TaxID=559131 RepID=A0ABD2NL67_9CUCU
MTLHPKNRVNRTRNLSSWRNRDSTYLTTEINIPADFMNKKGKHERHHSSSARAPSTCLSLLLGVDVEPTNSKGITSKSLIDYLVTNLKPEIYVRYLLKIRISDHYAQLLSFTLASTNFECPSSCTGKISTDYSLEYLKDALETFDWHVVYDLANDVDAAFNLFYAVFLKLFEECYSIRTQKPQKRDSHYVRTWLTHEMIELEKKLNEYS